MNRSQFYANEQHSDYQDLLNEEWKAYATRVGMDPNEEHVKHCDETWEEFVQRKAAQEKYIVSHARQSETRAAALSQQKAEREQRGAATIELLLHQEKNRIQSRTPCRHALYVDFDEQQQVVFSSQRTVLCSEEALLRETIEDWYGGFHGSLKKSAEFHLRTYTLKEKERVALEIQKQQEAEAEAARIAQEQQEQEKQRRIEEEMAERRRKEQLEMEKRAERKRREEEKRAAARAARQKTQQSNVPDEETTDT